MRGPIPFGRHLLLERIAVGGMAEVFRAKSFGVEGFERIVAVKKILASMAEDEEFIKMFIDEARIASYLTHQNIVQIYEFGKHEGVYFISMEYVAGRDLRTILDRCKRLKKPMDPPMACYIIGRVCEALDYAHRKRDPTGKEYRIIHRDVSPQNVIISYEGEVKLCDFGIAKAVTQSTRTQVGVLKGKFAYMSPEQVRGRAIDRRSDIFALGVIVYEMLTGERLFLGDSDYSTLEAVRAAKVPPPRTFNPAIPPRMEEVVLKMLAREPEQRYQWASEVLEDLHTYLVSAGQIFHAHNLRQYMQEAYERDIDSENAKLEAFMSLKLAEPRQESAGNATEQSSPKPAALAAPERPVLRSDTNETAQGHEAPPSFSDMTEQQDDEVSGTAVDPGLIAAFSSRSSDDEVPLVKPAPVAHDDLSATVMSDEDDPFAGAPDTTSTNARAQQAVTIADVDARADRDLQAEIAAAQSALLKRLEALKDGETIDASMQGDHEVSRLPRVVSSEASARIDTGDITGDRPIEDPAEDEAGRTSDWIQPTISEPLPSPAEKITNGEARRTDPAGPRRASHVISRQIREKKRDSGNPISTPAPSADALPRATPAAGTKQTTPAPATAKPSITPPPSPAQEAAADPTPPPQMSIRPAEAAAGVLPTTAPMTSARGLKDPRTMLIGASAAVLVTLILIVTLFLARGPSGASLHLETTPTNEVEVRLDGHLVAIGTPVDIENLSLGEHTIEVRAPGYVVYKQTFPIEELRPHTLTVPLVPEGKGATPAKTKRPPPDSDKPPSSHVAKEEPSAIAAAAPLPEGEDPARLPTQKKSAKNTGKKPIGYLVVSTTPSGLPVFIDGKATGLKTPLRDEHPLPVGNHEVSFEMDGGRRVTFPVTITEGGTTQLIKRLR